MNPWPTTRTLIGTAAAAVFALCAAGMAYAQTTAPRQPNAKADNRVQTIATDGETVIDLPVQRGQLAHVVLPPGETFALPPATGQGARCEEESHSWCIVAQGRDLFIKAKPTAKSNNLILVTERRRFAIELRAVERGGVMRLTLLPPNGNESGTAAAVIDPSAPSRTTRVGTVASAASAALSAQRILQERLAAAPVPRNAQYSMAVGKASEDIVPSMVFDDGRFTYLKFAGNRPLPALFQTGPDGAEETVNVRMGEDDLLVADRVARRFVLRLGTSVVIVVNDAFDLDGQPPVDGTTVRGVSRALSQVPRAPGRLIPPVTETSPSGRGSSASAQQTQERDAVTKTGSADRTPDEPKSDKPAPPANRGTAAEATAGGAP